MSPLAEAGPFRMAVVLAGDEIVRDLLNHGHRRLPFADCLAHKGQRLAGLAAQVSGREKGETPAM